MVRQPCSFLWAWSCACVLSRPIFPPFSISTPLSLPPSIPACPLPSQTQRARTKEKCARALLRATPLPLPQFHLWRTFIIQTVFCCWVFYLVGRRGRLVLRCGGGGSDGARRARCGPPDPPSLPTSAAWLFRSKNERSEESEGRRSVPPPLSPPPSRRACVSPDSVVVPPALSIPFFPLYFGRGSCVLRERERK